MKEYREKGKLIWVAPGALYFNLEQVEWLMPQLEDMREGNYPPEPSGGYVDIQRRITERASFEVICQVAAEIDIRLARTGLDRYLMEEKYCNGLSESEIAQNLYMDEDNIYKRIRSAVTYIASGKIPRWIDTEKRRGISYRDWVSRRRRQWLQPKCSKIMQRT